MPVPRRAGRGPVSDQRVGHQDGEQGRGGPSSTRNNTSEVLPILRAAGIAGQPVREGLDFLTGAIPEHSRLRPKGGRGKHTRFIAFVQAGLLSHPRFFHHNGVSETAAWCVG